MAARSSASSAKIKNSGIPPHSPIVHDYIYHKSILNNKLCGFRPRANYTDRATAACRRSYCQLWRIEVCRVVSAVES
jgi:hypothetical protein